MKHKHRVLPGHMGGEYTPENTLEVGVSLCNKNTSTHPMWHFANWQLWGRREDLVAWKGLAGLWGKEEIQSEKDRLGGMRGGEISFRGKLGIFDPKHKKKCEETRKENGAKMGPLNGLKNGEATKEKKKGIFDPLVRESQSYKETIRANGFRQGKINAETLSVPVMAKSVETGEVLVHPSAEEAARALGLRVNNIRHCLKKRRETTGGYRFSYLPS